MNNMQIDKQNGSVVSNNLNNDTSDKICGIYKISNSKYFYIGLSVNIRNRWKQHIRSLKKGVHKNIFMQRVYNKYKDLDPFEFSILCECDRKDLGTLEKKYFDLELINSDKIALNNKPCGLDFWTDEMLENSKKSHTGKKLSEEHRKKISEGQKGNIRKNQRIPIVQISLEGEFIKLWDSRTEVKKELGIDVQLSRKQSGGFQWQKYKDYKINPKGKVIYDNEQPVYQYSINNDFIAKYNSIKQASEATNIKHCNISNTIHGKQKTAGGFIWRT